MKFEKISNRRRAVLTGVFILIAYGVLASIFTQSKIIDDVLYYSYLNKFAGNRRFIDFEKVLGVKGTSRSWKVVDKLIEQSGKLQK